MNYNNIMFTFIIIVLFYLTFIKKENMSNIDIKKTINEIYQADIQSIRNLSKLANDLTNNGKLRVPGGLEIDGKLTVKDDIKTSKNIYWHNEKGKLIANDTDGANIELVNMQGRRGIHLFANSGNQGARINVNSKEGNNGIVLYNKNLSIGGIVDSSYINNKINMKINKINSDLNNYVKYGSKMKVRNEYTSYYLHICCHNTNPYGGCF